MLTSYYFLVKISIFTTFICFRSIKMQLFKLINKVKKYHKLKYSIKILKNHIKLELESLTSQNLLILKS